MALNAMMGAPQSVQGGLLGAAQGYQYPMTSGLLGAISGAGGVHPFAQQIGGLNPAVASQQAQMSQAPTDYTSLAMGLAGNPHAGPYSTAGNTVQPGSATNPTAGSTSGGSTGSSVVGGLLGALAKNPSLVKDAGNAIQGLLGNGGLSALGSQAASGTAAEMAAGAPAVAADSAAAMGAMAPAVGAAPTAAELGTTADALAPITTSAAPAASAATPAAASGGALGGAAALGVLAIPLIAGMATNSVSGIDFNGLLNEVKQGNSQGFGPKSDGLLPNGSIDPNWVKYNNALAELQGGAYESPWVAQALNNLGYLTYGQMGPLGGVRQGSGDSPAVSRLLKSY